MSNYRKWDIINKLIADNGYKSYLEIGTEASDNGIKINCTYKVGVDPRPINRIFGDFTDFYQVDSDMYFREHKDKFDKIGRASCRERV